MKALDLLRQKIPLPQELQKLQIAPYPVGWLTAKTVKTFSCSFCSDRGRPFPRKPRHVRKQQLSYRSAGLGKEEKVNEIKTGSFTKEMI